MQSMMILFLKIQILIQLKLKMMMTRIMNQVIRIVKTPIKTKKPKNQKTKKTKKTKKFFFIKY
jgi:hypothetical protein